jgi:hypothetical protein
VAVGIRENSVAKHAHIGVDHDSPPAPLPTASQCHAYRRTAVDQHPLDRGTALNHPATILDRRNQCLNQRVDPTLDAIST